MTEPDDLQQQWYETSEYLRWEQEQDERDEEFNEEFENARDD